MREAWLTQRAMYSALTGYLDVGDVYDEITDDAEPPYTVIGELTEVPDDTHEEEGTSATITLHIWSRATTRSEVLAIMEDIDSRLHHATLALEGGGSVFLTRTLSEVLKDESEPGETWRHGILIYRIRTLEAVP